MPSSYTNVLRFEKPGQGDYLNNWGTALGRILDTVEDAVTGVTEIVTAGGTITLSTANGTTDEARRAIVWVTGALTANALVLVPNAAKHYVVLNETTGGFTVGVRAQGGSNTVTIPQSRMGHIFATGDGRVVFVAPIADANGQIDTSALPVATQTIRGIVRLATDPEVATGTATDIVPSVKQLADQLAAIVTAGIADGDKGDVTVSGTGAVWTIDNGSVTGPKLGVLNDLDATQLGNIATALGATPAAIAAILAALSVFGPSGVGHAKGLVPDPGAVAGTTRFLREDGGWALPNGVAVTEAAAPPASPNPGDIWWDTVSETANLYIAAVGWIDVSTIGTPGSTYTEGAAPPASPNFGDRWWDTLTLTINVYTSSGWIQH